jgi:hypothetical protein
MTQVASNIKMAQVALVMMVHIQMDLHLHHHQVAHPHFHREDHPEVFEEEVALHLHSLKGPLLPLPIKGEDQVVEDLIQEEDFPLMMAPLMMEEVKKVQVSQVLEDSQEEMKMKILHQEEEDNHQEEIPHQDLEVLPLMEVTLLVLLPKDSNPPLDQIMDSSHHHQDQDILKEVKKMGLPPSLGEPLPEKNTLNNTKAPNVEQDNLK